MISLLKNSLKHADEARQIKMILCDSLIDDPITEADIRYINFNGRLLGGQAHQWKDDIVYLSIYFIPDADFESMHRCLCYITETITKESLPKKILIRRFQKECISVLQSCMYYAKGLAMQRKTEPMRYQLDASVFDDEGYIIDQGKMADIPFGFFNTKDKGCGWIAEYNLLKINGLEITMQECIENLERFSLTGELMGQPFFSMAYDLRSKGLPVRISFPSNSHAIHIMKNFPNGILLYSHSQGAHYAAFRNHYDGTITFYNAIYGKRYHRVKPEQFLSSYSLFHLSSVLYVAPRVGYNKLNEDKQKL